MANSNRGQVTLTAGGKEYTLSLSINATCELEDHFDLPIGKVAKKLQANPEDISMKDLRAFVWAALRDHHPDTTLLDAGKVATDAGVAATMQKVTECFIAAFPPTPQGGAKQDPRKAAKE